MFHTFSYGSPVGCGRDRSKVRGLIGDAAERRAYLYGAIAWPVFLSQVGNIGIASGGMYVRLP